MNDNKQRNQHHNKQQAGQGLVEYALILIFAAVAAILIINLLEPSIGDVFSRFVRNAPVAPPSLVNYTPPATFTATATADPNGPPTATPVTPTATNTITPTNTPTNTPIPTNTPTPSITPTPSATPICAYGPHVIPQNGSVRVQAEDYMCGGEGVAYHDIVTGGSGSCNASYRTDEANPGVGLENTSDSGGGCNVGWVRNGEWLRYEVIAPDSFRYDFRLRTAASNPGRVRIRVTNSLGTVSSGQIDIPDTNGWQNWTDVNVSDQNLSLVAGPNTVEIFIEDAGFNINYFEIERFVPNIVTWERRVRNGNDDAEERINNGSMYRDSSDLELIRDGSRDQEVGIRFTNVQIPQGANITNVYIEFTADESQSGATSLTIHGEDRNNAGRFQDSRYNISNRRRTSASVNWPNLPAWTTGNTYRTPDLTAIVQEIVDRGGWNSGNAMVFIITGSGHRTAESYNGSQSSAPLLHIEYLP